MMESKVLFPEPEAPTIAAVSPALSAKLIPHKISSDPVESTTDLLTCSTEIIESDMKLPLVLRYFSVLLHGCILAALCHTPSQAQNTPPKSTSEKPVVLVVGDSLSAEYGLARGTGWVALMQTRLSQEKMAYQVVNASISGDTTAGGRSRLPALLRQHQPSLVLIELGSNDALRGLSLKMTQDNLQAMATAVRATRAKLILIGMQIPPNYGQAYSQQFSDLFSQVAKDQQAGLVPFLLKNVADAPDAGDLFQPDRIHPAAAAHPRMLNNVWPSVKKLLR